MANIFTDNFNSYNDGDLNGQGSWTGDVGWDVQGVTVKEGAKALNCAGSAQTVIKTGTDTADGTQVIYFYAPTDSTQGVQIDIKDTGTGRIVAGLYCTGNWVYYIGATGTAGGSFSLDAWHYITIEWRSSDYTARYNVDGGTFTGWTAPANAFTSLSKIQLYRYSTSTGDFYIDYVAETPYVAPGRTQTSGRIQSNNRQQSTNRLTASGRVSI